MAHKKVTSPKIATIASVHFAATIRARPRKRLLEAHWHKRPANIVAKNEGLMRNASLKVLGPWSTAIKTRGILV